MSLFYKPDGGWAADFIPFFWEGMYHLFYLKDRRALAAGIEGVSWHHLVTRDALHFEDWGEAIPSGGPGSPDQWVFTGDVIEHEGAFFAFYTGHNPRLTELGLPRQVVMRATSPDLRVWTKDPDFRFQAPAEFGYEPDDWRDPFVFWNDEANEWWMLLAARATRGPSRTRGLVACAASRDLQTWTVREPFWEPGLFETHECPDLFRMGDWWYLIWSEYSDRFETRYRRSRSLQGPWLASPDDAFDTRAFYAAKTASDGERRFLFGWLATRDGDTDSGAWQWGGSLVVHELVQAPDGSLTVRAPAGLGETLARSIEIRPRPVVGRCEATGATIALDASERTAAALLAEMPAECAFEATLRFSDPTMTAGLLLRATDALECSYQVRLEPARQRIVFDRWPRPGDQPFILERPLRLQPDMPVRLRCFVSGSALVVYAGDTTALSCRMYDHSAGNAGLVAIGGRAEFSDVVIRSM